MTRRFDVWHQWPAVRVVERTVVDGEEIRLYEPAVFYRGTVEAMDGARAVAEAKRQGMSSAPLVRVSR